MHQVDQVAVPPARDQGARRLGIPQVEARLAAGQVARELHPQMADEMPPTVEHRDVFLAEVVLIDRAVVVGRRAADIPAQGAVVELVHQRALFAVAEERGFVPLFGRLPHTMS